MGGQETAIYHEASPDDGARVAVYPSKLYPGTSFIVLSVRDSVGGEKQVYSRYITRANATWLQQALADALTAQEHAGGISPLDKAPTPAAGDASAG